MSKAYCLMRDVIKNFHPDFIDNQELSLFGLLRPELFNVERLVEESLAAVGGYILIDGEHQDFCDGSDSKTSSFSPNPSSANSHSGSIKNVRTAGGNLKAGPLRVLIYNPLELKTHFYFLPRSFWPLLVSKGYGGLGIINYSYNLRSQDIPRFRNFQCNTFEKLATSKE